MVELRAGMRLRSVNGDTEVIVIRAPQADAVIMCGDAPMVPLETESGSREEHSGS
jgi:hypothetical protein